MNSNNDPCKGHHITTIKQLVAYLVYRWLGCVLLISQEKIPILGSSEAYEQAKHHSEEPVPPNYSQMAAEHNESLYILFQA